MDNPPIGVRQPTAITATYRDPYVVREANWKVGPGEGDTDSVEEMEGPDDGYESSTSSSYNMRARHHACFRE